MPIATGRYFIINVQTKNRAYLHSADSDEPIQGRFKQDELGEQVWVHRIAIKSFDDANVD